MDYDDTDVEQPAEPRVSGYVDNADIGLEMHLLIKDVETNELLVNQSGIS